MKKTTKNNELVETSGTEESFVGGKGNCPACAVNRLHTAAETVQHHPLAGHGYTKEQGWTHPDAKAAHDADALNSANAQHAAQSGTPEATHVH